MDLRNTPDGAIAESGDWEDLRDAAADQMTSTAKHALDGCIFGLSPTSAQTHVQIGEAYLNGNRLRLRADEAIDIAALTRPTGSMVAWVTVLASYTTEGSGTVTDDAGVQYVRITNDSIIITLARGANAANEAAAVKPSIPTGSIVLCDILLDASTSVGSLDGDPSRRPQCPDDDLQAQLDQLGETVNDIAAAALAAAASPNKGPTPSATSTTALRIDATWAAGTVPSGAPVINAAKLRWRQAGENWSTSRTFNLGNVQARNFAVPDADNDIQMQTQYGNGNGYGEWSSIGTIDEADIEAPPALTTRTFTADESWDWPYPQSSSARITISSGSGGDGGGGGAGGRGSPGQSGQDDPSIPGGDGGSGNAGADGGDGGDRGNAGSDGDGNGGNGGSPGTDLGSTDLAGGGGGGGGGPNGGDGGDGAGRTADRSADNYESAGGGGGEAGGSGGDTSVQIASIGVDRTADGGDPGSGGGGGGGHANNSGGSDGDDAGDANGGVGGVGRVGYPVGETYEGGAGGSAPGATTVIIDVAGLTVGTTINIAVGDGGEVGQGGAGGGGYTADYFGNPGSAGDAAGDAGSVTIKPLT